ncbi:hypothetical protein F5X68DRAFT_197275 [Plectosphaerella plurivora]|uniref:Pentatricopeptide repeat domain-containing protein n=1 Tax=Plectosphaerella plurivora TaxID=936078 RepID=A0A9P9ADC3_9PEZI|nr:hypothetical protein F5X68DRAFT_197275 [Plectosphaerella plurivora]
MSLGIKLLWRIRPQLVVTSPALARHPPTLPHPALPEQLLPSPWQSRCVGGSVRHASNFTVPSHDTDHDTRPTPPTPTPGPSTSRRVSHHDEAGLQMIQELESLLKDHRDFAVADKDGNTDIATTRLPIPAESVMDKPVNRYPRKRETLSSLSRYMRKKDAIQRVEERQAQHGRVPDWRVVLSMLRKNTLRATWNTPGNERIIWVSENIVDTLLHEPDHNIWDIDRRTECVLELSTDQVNIDDAGRRMVSLRLSGSDEAMDAAKAEITAFSFSQPSGSISFPEFDAVSNAIPSPTTSTTAARWSSARQVERPSSMRAYDCYVRYERIPRPREWTTRSLEAYIIKLTRARHPPHVMSRLYGPGVDGRMQAVALMQRVLSSEEASLALSVRAFKLALQFAMNIGPGCRPQVRALISTATTARLPLDTSVFNILLKGNARDHDLESFGDVLRLMGKRGLAPNFVTWTNFLSIIEDLNVKMHVCRAMDDRGLLRGLHGRRALAHEFVVYELEQERGRWAGVQAFLDRQDKKFGPGWLTQETSNRVIEELGRQGKFGSCIEFLDIVVPKGLTDVTTLNIILNHSLQHRRPLPALLALHRTETLGISLDKDSYHELFKLFRSLRKANCMAIVWRAACLKGRTTFGMRRIITDFYNSFPSLLTRNTLPAPPVLSHHNFRPESQYHLWRDVPTFHHPLMEPQLLAAMKASNTAEAEQSITTVEPILDEPNAIGPLIAYLYRQFWPKYKWRAERPLYALLVEANAADRELENRGKSRRERAMSDAMSAGSTDALSEVSTNLDRVVSPGVSMTYVDSSLKEMAELRPTIYSRTFGVTDAERDISERNDTPGSDEQLSEKL